MTFKEWEASLAAAQRDWNYEPPPVTVCKHKRGDCAECGTTDRRDAVHTTQGGRGVVGRLK